MSPPDPPKTEDEYAWAPWAVLVALLLVGALGFLGKLSPKHTGLTAADIPAKAPSVAPSAAAPPP